MLQEAWEEHLLLKFTSKKALNGFPPINKIDTAEVVRSFPAQDQKTLLNEIAAAYQCAVQQAAWDPQTESDCPHCQRPDTKFHRVFQCSATQDIRDRYQGLITWMLEEGVEWYELPVIHTHEA